MAVYGFKNHRLYKNVQSLFIGIKAEYLNKNNGRLKPAIMV